MSSLVFPTIPEELDLHGQKSHLSSTWPSPEAGDEEDDDDTLATVSMEVHLGHVKQVGHLS